MIVFNQFITELKYALEQTLPGIEAQELMAPPSRSGLLRNKKPSAKTRKGSVLILLYPLNKKIYTVLMLRPNYGGVHSGQISFPGGREEMTDASKSDTALRETREELGIDPVKIKLLGELSTLYIPPSDFNVSTFVAAAGERPEMVKDPIEVEEILEVPLMELLLKNSVFMERLNVRGVHITAPCFKFNGYAIWGATAMIISELREVVKKLASTKALLTNPDAPIDGY